MKVHARRYKTTGLITVYLYTNGLFNDAVSSSDYRSPNGKMVIEYEGEEIFRQRLKKVR
jgi:hypothetical protein